MKAMTEMAGLFGAVSQVPDTPYRGPDQSLNRIALSNSTAGEYAPVQATSNIGQLQPPRNIINASICSFSYFFVCLQIDIYIHIYIYILHIYITYIYVIYILHKTLCVCSKNLWAQQEGSTDRRLGRTK